jgi:hypothetical protein
LYALLHQMESAPDVPCFLGRFKAKLTHWGTQSIQSSTQHRVDLSTIQDSLLNINSELMNDELNIQSNRAQQLEEYAYTSRQVLVRMI